MMKHCSFCFTLCCTLFASCSKDDANVPPPHRTIIVYMVADSDLSEDARENVTIANADGSPVEEGAAVSDAAGYVWTYTATAVNDSLEGDRIEITASDLPGNVSQEVVSI